MQGVKKITKAKHAFEERFYRFDEDIQLVDYLTQQMIAGELSREGGFLDKDISKYSVLLRRAKNIKAYKDNRILLATHLKQTLYSAYVKDSYEEVLEYLKTIIKSAVNSSKFNHKKNIIGNNKVQLTAVDIIKLGSYENVLNEVCSRIFQSLEEQRDTLELVRQVFKRLGINDIKSDELELCIDFLNVRHYLVHADGKCPEEFIMKTSHNKAFKFSKKNGYIKLNFEFIQEFREAVLKIVNLIDTSLMKLNVLDDIYIHLNRKEK